MYTGLPHDSKEKFPYSLDTYKNMARRGRINKNSTASIINIAQQFKANNSCYVCRMFVLCFVGFAQVGFRLKFELPRAIRLTIRSPRGYLVHIGIGYPLYPYSNRCSRKQLGLLLVRHSRPQPSAPARGACLGSLAPRPRD